MNKNYRMLFLLLIALISACSSSEPGQTSTSELAQTPINEPVQTPTSFQPRVEEEITFTFGPNELFGILTKPTGKGPFPAIVMISGSVDSDSGMRAGVSSRYFSDHARKLTQNGFAVLRYDPPGVGKSSGELGFESLEVRADEATAAVRYLQSRPDIQADKVGLHGISQGAWVNAMAAADYPQDVAFIINISGSGVSVAEQQVHSIEAQSRDAAFSETDVTKASLFGRLLVDWQLEAPIFKDENESDAESLGTGPWEDFASLVYEPAVTSPADSLLQGIGILRSIQEEPWAEFLYLGLYVSQLESVTPEQVEALKAMTGPNLISDPAAYFTRVTSPVLAIFGEEDLLQPTEKSAALYEQYFREAGNEEFEIVVIPGVGHNVVPTTPGYWTVVLEWLDGLDF
jgi:pimeloyl-ACP methyl ester carboxylesterase